MIAVQSTRNALVPPFTVEDAQRASEEWSFNCGPAALAMVAGMICHNQLLLRGTLPDSQTIGPQGMDRNTEGSGYETGVSILTTTQSFSTAQLAELTGLSMRVLQRWCKSRHAPATMGARGNRPMLQYSEEQAVRVLILAELRARHATSSLERLAAFVPISLGDRRYIGCDGRDVVELKGLSDELRQTISLMRLVSVIDIEELRGRLKSTRHR